MAEPDLEIVRSKTDEKETITINEPFELECRGIKVSDWVFIINKPVIDEATKIDSYDNRHHYSDWNFMENVEVVKYINHTNQLYVHFFCLQSLTESVFKDYYTLETVLLPPTVHIIPYGCFSGCQELKSIKAEYVNFIGDYAFQGCVWLERINFKLIGGIGKRAFDCCYGLESVTNLADWCFIDEGAFLQCHKLKITITLDANLNRGCFDGLSKERVEVIEEGKTNYKINLIRKYWDLIRLERNADDEIINTKLIRVFDKYYIKETHYPDTINFYRKEIPIEKDVEIINPADFMYNMHYFREKCRESDKYNTYEKELKEEIRQWSEKVDVLEDSVLNGRNAFLETREALFGV